MYKKIQKTTQTPYIQFVSFIVVKNIQITWKKTTQTPYIQFVSFNVVKNIQITWKKQHRRHIFSLFLLL